MLLLLQLWLGGLDEQAVQAIHSWQPAPHCRRHRLLPASCRPRLLLPRRQGSSSSAAAHRLRQRGQHARARLLPLLLLLQAPGHGTSSTHCCCCW
jgi:hypothetical protein